MSVDCPSCRRSIGGDATEGGLRVRLGIVLVDPATGRVHGPCPHCKADVDLVEAGRLAKALVPQDESGGRRRVVPGLRIARP